MALVTCILSLINPRPLLALLINITRQFWTVIPVLVVEWQRIIVHRPPKLSPMTVKSSTVHGARSRPCIHRQPIRCALTTLNVLQAGVARVEIAVCLWDNGHFYHNLSFFVISITLPPQQPKTHMELLKLCRWRSPTGWPRGSKHWAAPCFNFNPREKERGRLWMVFNDRCLCLFC